jgi:hypothetical protein
LGIVFPDGSHEDLSVNPEDRIGALLARVADRVDCFQWCFVASHKLVTADRFLASVVIGRSNPVLRVKLLAHAIALEAPMDEIFVDVVPRDKVTVIRRLPLSYEISNGDQRFTIELNDGATVDTLKVAIESIIDVALDRISLCVGDEEITGNGMLIDRYSKLQRILLNVQDPNYEFVEESGQSHFFQFSEDVTIQFIFEFLTETFHCHVGLSDSRGKLSRRLNESFFGRGVYRYCLRLRGFKFQFLLSGHSRITKVRLQEPTIMGLRLLLRRSPNNPCKLMIVRDENELVDQRLVGDEIVIRIGNQVFRDSEAFPAKICESDRVIVVELVSRDVTFVLEGQEKRLKLSLDERMDKVENGVSEEFGFRIKLKAFHSSDLTVRECFRDNSPISVNKIVTAIPIFSELVKDFGEMEEIEEIGKGAYGTVKLVRDPSTNALIALKTLDHKASDTFMKEVEMLMKLRHPCILQIVGYSLPTKTVPAQIGTEFAKNRSLRDFLRNAAKPDETGIAIIICGIVLGMKFIHSRGIIHRDLKPENILIDEENHAKIGDLGSGRFVNIDRSLTVQVGTPLYMAPEMHDDCGYSEMIDSYSFGLILFELLVGQPVFPSTIATLALIKKSAKWERPALPGAMNETVKKIIHRCWAPDPSIRESFSEIFDYLETIRFQITPNVDVGRMKTFVSHVRRDESQ